MNGKMALNTPNLDYKLTESIRVTKIYEVMQMWLGVLVDNGRTGEAWRPS